jgi:hypothetical protein
MDANTRMPAPNEAPLTRVTMEDGGAHHPFLHVHVVCRRGAVGGRLGPAIGQCLHGPRRYVHCRKPLPCPALPCAALPCPALPCPALPCPALPCPALPCPALSVYLTPLACIALHCIALHCRKPRASAADRGEGQPRRRRRYQACLHCTNTPTAAGMGWMAIMAVHAVRPCGHGRLGQVSHSQRAIIGDCGCLANGCPHPIQSAVSCR